MERRPIQFTHNIRAERIREQDVILEVDVAISDIHDGLHPVLMRCMRVHSWMSPVVRQEANAARIKPASRDHAENTGSASLLYSDWQALTQERRGAWLLVNFHHPSSEPLHQAHCLLTTYAGCLNDEGNKVGASNDVRILGDLTLFYCRRCNPASVLLYRMYNCAKVLGHLASHTRYRPLFHGTCVTVRPRSPTGAQQVWLLCRHDACTCESTTQ